MTAKWNDLLSHWIASRLSLGKQIYKTHKEFYNALYAMKTDNDTRGECIAECLWLDEGKPYYRLYPGVIKPFIRINASTVDMGHLRMPTRSLLIQVPEGCITDGNFSLRNILLASGRTGKDRSGIRASIELDKINKITRPLLERVTKTALVAEFIEGVTLEQVTTRILDNIIPEAGLIKPVKLITDAVKIIAVCLLLEQDPQVIQPDVLNDDLTKWKMTLDPKYVEKAKRRGKFGWVVGRDIEVSPHIRKESPFALYWTGKGRTIPIIRHRASCIVHRKVVETIPTGYME